MLQTLNFNVADVEFRCCRHVMLGFVSRKRRGGGILMLDVAHNTGHNMGRNMGCLGFVPGEDGGPPDAGCFT
jgi:hypothetical protein